MSARETIYGTPDYQDVAEDGTVTHGSWAKGLSDAEIRTVEASGGRVAFTLNADGETVVVRDQQGRLIVQPVLQREYAGLPLWGWLLGLGALYVGTR